MSNATAETRETLKADIAALEAAGKFNEAGPLKARLGAITEIEPLSDRDQQIEQLKSTIAGHEAKREFAAAGRAKVALALLQSR